MGVKNAARFQADRNVNDGVMKILKIIIITFSPQSTVFFRLSRQELKLDNMICGNRNKNKPAPFRMPVLLRPSASYFWPDAARGISAGRQEE